MIPPYFFVGVVPFAVVAIFLIHRLVGAKKTMSTTAEIQAAIAASIAATTASTDVAKSAVLALDGIGQRITDAIATFVAANPGVDVSALTAATAAESASTAAIAAAIVANTPAAPVPATDPTVTVASPNGATEVPPAAPTTPAAS